MSIRGAQGSRVSRVSANSNGNGNRGGIVGLPIGEATTSTPAAPILTHTLSSQQQAVVDWVRDGRGSAFVEALAGSGKTFTLIAASRIMQGSVAFTAFNKKIAEEIRGKVGNQRNIRVATFHSFGLAAWRGVASPSLQIDERVKTRMMYEACEVPWPMRSAVGQLVSMAKQSAVEVEWTVDDDAKWREIIEHYDILLRVEDDGRSAEDVADDLIYSAVRCIAWARSVGKDIIDFDDMIWLPLVEQCSIQKYDWVIVDEMQDSNTVRRLFARRMMRDGGRSLWSGDRFQSIYGFCHPPGTAVKTPSGRKWIEDLRVGDPVIVSTLNGEIEGWNGSRTVLETHQYHHSGNLLKIKVGDREVEVTPHHKIPVSVDPEAEYYTYVMRRCGVYRVGHCQAYTSGQFMLQLRKKTEKVDAVWILASHGTKDEAIQAESRLLMRVKGCTFQLMSDEDVRSLPTDEVEALKILGEHGRMVDFPLLVGGIRSEVRIARSGAFITEACNIIDGMLVAFYDPDAVDNSGGRRGRGRHKFDWYPVSVSSRPYSGPVYGITVQPCSTRKSGKYVYQAAPLYFAGTAETDQPILVHNTGATPNAVDLIVNEFKCETLPLTVTFRCSKAATRLAQTWVPHITAHEDNQEGSVVAGQIAIYIPNPGDHPEWTEASPTPLAPGDAILCRNTKPLVSLAFSLIREGIACHVEGRDIGKSLDRLASKWKVDTVVALVTNLEAYRRRETDRLIAQDARYAIEALNDRIDTLLVITEDCETVQQVRDKINRMFADTDGSDKPKTVLLSTIHRVKGREWSRVFILGWNVYMPSKWARQDWEIEQERNLRYVAVTRCRRDLILTGAFE